MGLRITGSGKTIENNIAKAQREASDSLERLSSGVRFTRTDPLPADRAISDSLRSKLRDLTSYKRNANEGIGVVQLADATLNELSNMTIRLKELATQSTSNTISDKERQFLFVEYQSLHDEMTRIAETTSLNGSPILNGGGSDGRGGSFGFRVGSMPKGDDEADMNLLKLTGLDSVIALPAALGLPDVRDLLSNPDGISVDDVIDLFESDADTLSGAFDMALDSLGGFRASFGAFGSRLGKALGVIDVTEENVAAANSRVADVDYASEIANLTKANILVQAGTSLLAQGSFPAQAILTLVKTVLDD